MRVHPISLALQYLKGRRVWMAAPYHGGAPYDCVAKAIADLRWFTGQDFGSDAVAWGEWLRRNRKVYYHTPTTTPPRIRPRPTGISAAVTEERIREHLRAFQKAAGIPSNWISPRRSSPDMVRRRAGKAAADFLKVLQHGDEIRSFRSPAGTWRSRVGRRGYVVLRAGRVVKSIVTTMN
jgi:hypothetical protein